MKKMRWMPDRFHLALLILCAAIFVYQALVPLHVSRTNEPILSLDPSELHVFYHPDCPHCHREIQFVEGLKTEYSQLKIHKHDIAVSQERDLFTRYAQQQNIGESQRGTPLLIVGEHFLVGYAGDVATNQTIERWVQQLLAGGPVEDAPATSAGDKERTVELPLFGEVSLFTTSLPVLAVLLGLVDGFNPCAMWVLVYLISLIVGIKDRRRVFTLIGVFLFASGVLYFLFMTAWLNVFLWVGYTHVITVLVGLTALYMGIVNIRSFIASGGQVVCPVGDIGSRQKTMSKMRDLVASPLSIVTFLGIVALAFAVNSIEFICSSALPAIFTHVLSVAELPTFTYYLYILLYVFCFMLDDLIIFSAAAFAVERFAGEKYASYCHVIGGVLMVSLGVMLTFFPEYLR